MIKFEVTNRFSGKVQFIAEIDCEDSASRSFRLGLAAKWALKTGANLVGANLRGANLRGANLRGAKWGFAQPVARATRTNDEHEFFLWRSLWGGHAIKAGCRLMSLTEYREHIESKYPDSAKAKETGAILDYFEARLSHMEAQA